MKTPGSGTDDLDKPGCGDRAQGWNVFEAA
jgi:hypothetical protein